MIRTFRNREPERIFDGQRSTLIPGHLLPAAQRKLIQIDAATAVEDLREPPSNHLKVLSGDRAGQWSIRINQQYRICFRWEDGNAYDVEVTDYH